MKTSMAHVTVWFLLAGSLFWTTLPALALDHHAPFREGSASATTVTPAEAWSFADRAFAEALEGHSLVRAALNEWLTWMRPTLIDAYEHYTYMRHLMWPVYEAAGLPEALLFGILAKESGGRVHSVSRAGAAGPLQFMHHTGLRLGLTTDDDFDLRFDPTAATHANVAYLKERFAEHDGNLELALAAYNLGETRVRRLVRNSDDPSFWNPEFFRQLPRETQEYVPYVLAAALLFQRPEAYGLILPSLNPTPDRVVLQAPLSLSELSVCLGQSGIQSKTQSKTHSGDQSGDQSGAPSGTHSGVQSGNQPDHRAGWFRTLRNLNARHDHDATLPTGTIVHLPAPLVPRYHEHCLAGPRLALAHRLHQAREERRLLLAVRTYTVRSGDTLSTIAQQQGCPSARTIAEANGLEGPGYLIRTGQQLKLQGCRAS